MSSGLALKGSPLIFTVVSRASAQWTVTAEEGAVVRLVRSVMGEASPEEEEACPSELVDMGADVWLPAYDPP